MLKIYLVVIGFSYVAVYLLFSSLFLFRIVRIRRRRKVHVRYISSADEFLVLTTYQPLAQASRSVLLTTYQPLAQASQCVLFCNISTTATRLHLSFLSSTTAYLLTVLLT